MIRIMENYFEEQKIGFATITGASRKRGEIISRFQNDQNCRIFVGSLKAGGTGIDLSAASVVIHYDRWWNSAKEDQATDRVHRIGQKNSVNAWYLVSKGTIEDDIVDLLDKKRKVLNAILDGKEIKLEKSILRELMDKL